MSSLKKFKTDIHIHSCLSPCGDWNMSPKRIIEKSSEVGLDLIAICDHNTVENAEVAIAEGKKKGVHVLPGLEICSKEEVHILALFDDMAPALEMQRHVYSNLPGKNNPDVFGFQVVANERDEVLGELERLREQKQIASSQEATVNIRSTDEELVCLVKDQIGEKEFAAICIVSEVEIDKLAGQVSEGGDDITSEIGNVVVAKKSEHQKCDRCWNYWPSVGKDEQHPDLCERCVSVVDA